METNMKHKHYENLANISFENEKEIKIMFHIGVIRYFQYKKEVNYYCEFIKII